jgi:1-deoxy-D-xylulose-5-phosphate reductoisomerase
LHPDRFKLSHIAVNGDWEAALRIALEFGCESVAVSDPAGAARLKREAPAGAFSIVDGPDSAAKVAAAPVDVVLAAISGSAGLPSVLAALRAGNRVALANKESLVCGGRALLGLAAAKGVQLMPVDSEHSAIFQSMLAGKRDEVASIVLTASGGPFRNTPLEQMRQATPEQALAHPNWSMGMKITIDSATLANKGLELIEAAYLFDIPESAIEVVINPSSILHSAVQFRDGSMIAQLGVADMRPPIALALSWPDRLETGVKSLSLSELGRLEFQQVDYAKFPCLSLARASLGAPGGPLLFNAANEIAVAAFLERRIGFMEIPDVISDCMDAGHGRFACALDDILEANASALAFCRSRLLARAA